MTEPTKPSVMEQIARDIRQGTFPKKSQDTIAEDQEVERLMTISDEELLAEAIAAGDDPEEIAREMRKLFEDAVAQVAARSAER